jgi:hypothetical protein
MCRELDAYVVVVAASIVTAGPKLEEPTGLFSHASRMYVGRYLL